jgi:hypothetical protein
MIKGIFEIKKTFIRRMLFEFDNSEECSRILIQTINRKIKKAFSNLRPLQSQKSLNHAHATLYFRRASTSPICRHCLFSQALTGTNQYEEIFTLPRRAAAFYE